MWHTDWKYLEGKGWLIAYLDDASRFVASYGLFDSATSANAVKVLKDAIKRCGKPATILSDHGSQFYATESEEKTKGVTLFEKFLRAGHQAEPVSGKASSDKRQDRAIL